MDSGARKELLIEAIRDPEPARRGEAAYEMGLSRDASFLPFLERALEDSEPKVRWRAVQAIGKLDLASPPAALSGLLQDESAAVRAEALAALGRYGRAEYVDAFARLLDDPDLQVRYKAIEALGDIGTVPDLVLGRVLFFLEDANSSLRMHAALTLGKCRYRPAAPALVRRLADPQPTVRGPAAWALGRLRDDTALLPLIHSLQDEGEFVRIYVYQALVDFGKRAIPLLERAIPNADPGQRQLLERLIEEIREGE
ncbi:MAG: HEAT repeat domain-containing protein [bacterium]